MNDRFKFRIYQKSTNKMVYVESIFAYNFESKGLFLAGNFGDTPLKELEENKIMQCTGLQDKNGNLIYEGDIVRTKRGHNGSKYCPLGERTYNVSFDCQMLHDGEIYEKEIIGNIYENPELLKDGE